MNIKKPTKPDNPRCPPEWCVQDISGRVVDGPRWHSITIVTAEPPDSVKRSTTNFVEPCFREWGGAYLGAGVLTAITARCWKAVGYGPHPKTLDDEISLRLDPTLSDTDGDGLSDAQNIGLGLNSLFFDLDSNGLTDYNKVYVYETLPTQIADGDGLSDVKEI